MLFRCNVDEISGLMDLSQCALLGAFFTTRGHKVAYAVNREGVERARSFLGSEVPVYRIPSSRDEDAERMGHLARQHKHRNVFVMLRNTNSAYLFQMTRFFAFSAVLDRGSSFMLYGNIVVNGRINAHSHSYSCHPETRLLLGPKFHVCDATPVAPPAWQEPFQDILVMVGGRLALLRKLVATIAAMPRHLRVHVLAGHEEILNLLEELKEAHPGCPLFALKPGAGTFAYHDFPLIITEAGDLCLEFAHQGLCFATVATEKEQLQQAYSLDQLEIAPTLGWYESTRKETIEKILKDLLVNSEKRQRLSCNGRQLIDGQGIFRIARFVPSEPTGIPQGNAE